MSSLISTAISSWQSLSTSAQLGLGGLGAALLILLFIRKSRVPQAEKKRVVLKPQIANPKKDVVYLFQFAPIAKSNASPFCLKVETYLKIHNIPFEIVKGNHLRKSPKGKLPIIELNGEVITDSDFIINKLKQTFGDPDANLTPAQKGISLTVQRTLEEHLYNAAVYFRWVNEEGWGYWGSKGLIPFLPAPLRPILVPIVRKNIFKSLWGHGMGRFSEEEMISLARDDIRALESLLAAHSNGKFFWGNDKPTSIDSALYGILFQIILSPIPSPLAREAGLNDDKSFPQVRAYSFRMKQYVESVASAK